MKTTSLTHKPQSIYPANILTTLANFATNLIPRHCLFCLEKTHSHSDLCHQCVDALSLNHSCCQRCASPMEQVSDFDIKLCGNCLSHHFYYDKVYSPYLYSEDIRYLITKFKYQKKIHYASVLAELFIQKSSHIKDFQLPEVIIPMPMHNKRLRKRGFNQALEISRFFASWYQLPLDYNSFIRSRYTNLQAGLVAAERQKNIHQAFSVKESIKKYKHIALIDDVMTTGSTANEAAKVLKQKGVAQVDVWTIARAGLN